MQNDIQPPKRPLNTSSQPAPNTPPPSQVPPSAYVPSELPPATSYRLPWYRRPFLMTFLIFCSVVLIVAATGYGWYTLSLLPLKEGKAHQKRVQVAVEQGSTPKMIAQTLKDRGVIRSEEAFRLYVRLHDQRGNLQAGVYVLSPTMSTQKVVSKLVSGDTSEFKLTLLPGQTTDEIAQKLVASGYSNEEVQAALKASYDSPLLASRPDGASLEGYIYGGSFEFEGWPSVQQIFEKSFQNYWDDLKQNNIIDGIKKHGLTLHQGIILASIVQKEVPSPQDQRQVAQVFYSRLKKDIKLGSDVTFQYAAKKANQKATPDFDSPYNTRTHAGLPPGPIAVPGLSALKAVANPAKGNYLFFVSGDNGKTYFSYTNHQHEQNVQAHCHEGCR